MEVHIYHVIDSTDYFKTIVFYVLMSRGILPALSIAIIVSLIIPAVIVVALAFHIPEKMKTPFKKEFIAATVEGTKKGYHKSTFDELAITEEEDLLDS